MIDKIIAKKEKLAQMPDNVVEARERLGRACIEVLKQHDRLKKAGRDDGNLGMETSPIQ